MDRSLQKTPAGPFATLAVCALLAFAVVAVPAASAANPRHAATHARAKKHRRHHGRRRHRRDATARVSSRSRGLNVSGNAAVSSRVAQSAQTAAPAALEAGCDGSLAGWNTAGVGESIPTTASDVVRSGTGACRFQVTGSQDRSELIFGGNGGGSTAGMVEFHEGDEYFYAFSFNIDSMVYGHPGAHNLIMQFKGNDNGSPYFALGLWDYAGDDGHSGGRGLWTEGEATGGNRFLAPVAEHEWHDVAIHFKASAQGAGFYEVFLDGNLVDARSGVSMIPPEAEYCYIKDGIYRNGSALQGTSEIQIDAAKLGKTLESVQPS
jgi:Ni/Co efflux regulator RcnB